MSDPVYLIAFVSSSSEICPFCGKQTAEASAFAQDYGIRYIEADADANADLFELFAVGDASLPVVMFTDEGLMETGQGLRLSGKYVDGDGVAGPSGLEMAYLDYKAAIGSPIVPGADPGPAGDAADDAGGDTDADTEDDSTPGVIRCPEGEELDPATGECSGKKSVSWGKIALAAGIGAVLIWWLSRK